MSIEQEPVEELRSEQRLDEPVAKIVCSIALEKEQTEAMGSSEGEPNEFFAGQALYANDTQKLSPYKNLTSNASSN